MESSTSRKNIRQKQVNISSVPDLNYSYIKNCEQNQRYSRNKTQQSPMVSPLINSAITNCRKRDCSNKRSLQTCNCQCHFHEFSPIEKRNNETQIRDYDEKEKIISLKKIIKEKNEENKLLMQELDKLKNELNNMSASIKNNYNNFLSENELLTKVKEDQALDLEEKQK